MATSTTRLGLRKPVGADTVQVSLDVSGSMDTIDAAVDRVCTSSTRPATPFLGMRCYETDTGRFIVCGQASPVLWGYYNALSATSSTRPAVAGTQGLFAGTKLLETDTHNKITYNGSGWEHDSIPVVTANTQIINPYDGQLIFNKTDNVLYKYQAAGSVWKGLYAPAHARYVRTAAIGAAWNGDKQASFPTARTTDPNVTPSGGSGDTQNTYFTLQPGVWRIEAGTRQTGGSPQLTIATGTTWGIANIIGPGNGADLNSSGSVTISLSAATAICVNIWNSAANNYVTNFGDCNFISFTRQFIA